MVRRPPLLLVMLRSVLLCLFGVLAVLGAGAQEADRRARIAVLEVANPGSDPRLAPACRAVSDTVRLTLRLMETFAVIEQPGVNPATDHERFRRWCAEQRVDQAVYGEVRARAGGGYAVALKVYDRLQDKVTIEREERTGGILEVFEATDAAVLALLEALSGEHVAFGAVELVRGGEEGEYVVLIDGVEVGQGVRAVRNVLIGPRTVVVRQQRLTGPVDLVRAAVVVPEDGAVSVRFDVPYLTAEEIARIREYEEIIDGRFYDAEAPSIVADAIASALDFIGDGPSFPHLDPLYQGYRMKAVLHEVFVAEQLLRLDQPTDEAFAALREIAVRAGSYARPDEVLREAHEAMLRCFGLLRVSAIGELAASRWDEAASRYELLQSVIEAGFLGPPPSFAEEREFVASAYAEYVKGWKPFTSGPMRKKVRDWFGPVLEAAAKAMAAFGVGTGQKVLVASEPPGMMVKSGGVEAGIAPVLLENVRGREIPLEASDAWFGRVERKAALRGMRTVVIVDGSENAVGAVRPQAQPAVQTGPEAWTLAWNPVPDAVRYDVQVFAASPQGRRIIEEQSGLTETKYVLPRALRSGSRYSWRVRPIRSDGVRGPWSAEAFFTGQLVWNWRGMAQNFDGAQHRQVVFNGDLWVFRDSYADGVQRVRRIAKEGFWQDVTSSAPFGPLAKFGLCAFDDRLWVIGGLAGATKTHPGRPLDDVWSSRDGTAWEKLDVAVPFPARSGFVCLVFKGRIWIIGGTGRSGSGNPVKYADAWSSADGRTWRKEADGLPLAGENLSGAVFQEKIWLFEDPRIASSPDGLQWNVEPAIPGSSSDWRGSWMGTFRERLWIIRGQPMSPMSPQQEYDAGMLWSADGRNWTRPLPASEQRDFRLVVASYAEFDGRLWRIGGEIDGPDGYVGYNDIWAGRLLE